MSLAGLLRQDLIVELVSWVGTSSSIGSATTLPARIEEAQASTTSATGATVEVTHLAYVSGDAIISRAHRITLPDGTQPLVARVETMVGGDGKSHHKVVHLAPAGTDTVTITRSAAAGTWDPATGLVSQSPADLVWQGTATITPSRAFGDKDAAGQNIFTQGTDVLVTLHTPALHVGDVVTVTTSDDPALANTVMRVLDVAYGADQFYRRLACTRDLSN